MNGEGSYFFNKKKKLWHYKATIYDESTNTKSRKSFYGESPEIAKAKADTYIEYCKRNCVEPEGINGINAANYIESNYYTVEQYSDFHNVRPSYIRKLINRGLVKGAINIATVNFVPKDTPSPNGLLP